MAKKIWYSSPLNIFWNVVYPQQKRITPYLSDEQIYNALHRPNESFSINTDTNNNHETFITGLEMWWKDYNKDFLHIFFIDKYLQTFLENMKLADLNSIKDFLFHNGMNKKVIYIKTNTSSSCVTYYFGIHIPYETDGYAFQFNLHEDSKLELFYFHGKQFGGLTDTMYVDLLNTTDKKLQILTKCFRLAINTIAYMKCFPECVVDGVPKITVERDEGRTDKNIILNISDKTTDPSFAERIKKPHFRKGYFKILRSDFYTKKKGEIIFVKETMVNGISKTVYTVDKIDSVIDL